MFKMNASFIKYILITSVDFCVNCRYPIVNTLIIFSINTIEIDTVFTSSLNLKYTNYKQITQITIYIK